MIICIYIYICIYVHAVILENRKQMKNKSITNLGYRIAVSLALGDNPFPRRDDKCALQKMLSKNRRVVRSKSRTSLDPFKQRGPKHRSISVNCALDK